MTSREQVEIYNITTRSLRELLIPEAIWVSEVEEIESYHNLVVRCQPINDPDPYEVYYMVPYPFKEPFYVSLLRAKHPDAQYHDLLELDSITEKEYSIWATGISNRITNFRRWALPDTVVSFLDGDPNIGLFVHATTGEVVPFEYDKLETVLVSKMQLQDKLELIKQSIRKNPKDLELQSAARCTAPMRYMYDMWYHLVYHDGKGDIFREKNDCKCVTAHAPMRLSDVEQTTEYIDSMIQEHAKCIILP